MHDRIRMEVIMSSLHALPELLINKDKSKRLP